jgi:hypothetical protein
MELGEGEIRWDWKETSDDGVVTVGQPDLKEIALNYWLTLLGAAFPEESRGNTFADLGFEALAFLSLLAASESFFDASYGCLGAALEARGFAAFGIAAVELNW